MSKRVVVVGGGVIGLCCAHALSRDGHRVTLIERGGPQDDSCSLGNAGLVVPSHIVPLAAPGVVLQGLKWMRDPQSPFYVRPALNRDLPALASWGWQFFRAGTRAHVECAAPFLRDLNLASRAAFEKLHSELDDFDFSPRGLLMLFKTAHGLDEEARIVEQTQKLGTDAQILDAAQTRAKENGLHLDIVGSAYYPEDCHLSPHRFVLALQKSLQKSNVDLRWNCAVTGWKRDGQNENVVRAAKLRSTLPNASASTCSDEIEADEWVLCGGSWSNRMARGLGLKLPMQAGKGYSLTLDNAAQRPNHPAILGEARVAVTPMGNSLRFAGTMEINGLNTQINPNRVLGIVNAVPRYFPEFSPDDFRDVKAWAGLRPCSPDGLAFVGRTQKFRNFSVATGHAMLGLSLAPITGQLIAQTIAGQTPQLSTTLLNPDRYA